MPKDKSAGETASYSTILKSTSIIGGSKAVEYLIAMMRVKSVALLLGPSGVGMVGLFTSSVGLVGQLTGLGIGQAGVREIARASSAADEAALARAAIVLRRVCWITGLLGWSTAAMLSWWLSMWAFDSSENATLIALLGSTLLIAAISGGQSAVIQGTRRIGDLARMSVLSSGLGTSISIAIYALWREAGIVPAMIASSALTLLVSWWYSRKIQLNTVPSIGWKETLLAAKSLSGLGFAFMWGGLLAAFADIAIRGLVVRDSGIDGSGMYQAAWALSGMFAGFVLGAMGADFYPRLSALTNDHSAMNRVVNEQIEIGVLLTLPGLIATLFFGPLAIVVFYSSKFGPAAELLPWFVLGIFCRVVSFPLGFTILAKGASRWYFFTQTHFFVVQLALVYVLIGRFGLQGVGVASFLSFIPAGVLNLLITRKLTDFRWSRRVQMMIFTSSVTILLAFVAHETLPSTLGLAVGAVTTAIVAIVNMRGLTARLGKNHRISRMVTKLPCGKWLSPQSM